MATEKQIKEDTVLNAAYKIREYCNSLPSNCENCIFDKNDPDAVFFKGCLLNDPDHLPETWELEKIKIKEHKQK